MRISQKKYYYRASSYKMKDEKAKEYFKQIDNIVATDTKYKTYLGERKLLINASAQEEHKFDMSILTLNILCFLSCTVFLKYFISGGVDENPAILLFIGNLYLLTAAKLLFVLSTLTVIVSFKLSVLACFKAIENLEATFENKAPGKNIYIFLVRLCNFIGVLFLAYGMIVFIIFVLKNYKL